jgi:hypothetical protein
VTCHRTLFGGLALRWVGVNTRPTHVGFLVNKIALERVFFSYYGFSLRVSVHHGFLLIHSSITDVTVFQELTASFSHIQEWLATGPKLTSCHSRALPLRTRKFHSYVQVAALYWKLHHLIYNMFICSLYSGFGWNQAWWDTDKWEVWGLKTQNK